MLTFKEASAIFERRKKGTARKRIYSDCWIYKDDPLTVRITYERFVCWNRHIDHKGSITWTKTVEEVALAELNSQDILTMQLDREYVQQASCNRLSQLYGRIVYSDKRRFAAYEEHVRVCNSRRLTADMASVPYFKGLQVDLRSSRVLNPKEDVKKVVAREAINNAKAQTKALSKLARVMVKMGAFDDFARMYMDQPWKLDMGKAVDVATIRLENAEFNDVEKVLVLGGGCTARPDRYERSSIGMYVNIDKDVRVKRWLQRAVLNGMEKVRRNLYDTNNGYERIIC